MSRAIVIHPGFGKSGTTTLQENLFAKHRQIVSVGRPYRRAGSEACNLTEALEGIHFDVDHLRQLLERAVEEKAKPEHKCILLSDEILMSNAYMRRPIAERLKTAFPDARIVFTIRNQIRALESYYANHGRILKRVPRPYLGRQVSLENWLEYAFENKATSYIGLIDYAASIGIYEKIFGREKVHVFLFEEMTDRHSGFVDDLCGCLDVDAEEARRLLYSVSKNQRVSRRRAGYAKIRDKLLPGVNLSAVLPFGKSLQSTLVRYLSKGENLRVDLPENWKSRLHEVYREGNAGLAEHRGLPLADYGYPT